MRHLVKGAAMAALFALAACNPMKELDDADKAVAHFHSEFEARDFDGIWTEATEDFRNAQPKDDYDRFMGAIRARLGTVETSKRQGFNLNTNNGVTTVQVNQATHFSSGDGTEDFVFVRDGERLQLLNYHVTSQALAGD